ncbi:MAG: hypothetical protein IKF52_03335 [Clostridia bacterium]|nr:hypothetical protein [Clostridia bacterium]
MKVEIGDRITLFNGEEFRVVNILRYKDKDFMYLLNIKEPDKSWIYEYRDIDGKVQVKKEKDEELIKEILELIKSEK